MTKGLNFGVDFQGGRSYVVRFEKPMATVDVIDALKGPFGKSPEVKTFGGENQVKITTTYLIDDPAQDAEVRVTDKLNEGLKAIGGNYTVPAPRK